MKERPTQAGTVLTAIGTVPLNLPFTSSGLLRSRELYDLGIGRSAVNKVLEKANCVGVKYGSSTRDGNTYRRIANPEQSGICSGCVYNDSGESKTKCPLLAASKHE